MSGSRIGQQIGNYRLVRVLGQGGQASVYLGQHQRLAMQAAIKILLTSVTGEDVQRFQQEAQTIARLQHPHIIRILDFDVKEGLPFLVMEYASNGSLRQRSPKGAQLPIPLVISYAKQVGLALQYAHDQRFIHRDIKPENMLLDYSGRLVLSDFGIATIMHRTASFDQQTVAGTTPYMAPEQLQGRPCASSDQYALGITVYEWLTGRHPFQGNATEVAMQHILTTPPTLRQYNPAISPDLELVVLTALEKDVSRRYSRVVDFFDDLEASALSSQYAGTTRTSWTGFSTSSGIPPLPFSSPTSVFSQIFNTSISSSSFFSETVSRREKNSSTDDEDDPDYAELCRQIQSQAMPYAFGGWLVVRASGCPDGAVIQLAEQSFWSLASRLMETIPGTRYAEVRRYPIAQNRFVSAAVFSELFASQYVVWTEGRMGTAVVYDGEARVVSL